VHIPGDMKQWAFVDILFRYHSPFTDWQEKELRPRTAIDPVTSVTSVTSTAMHGIHLMIKRAIGFIILISYIDKVNT
jgi:hypothetical protein